MELLCGDFDGCALSPTPLCRASLFGGISHQGIPFFGGFPIRASLFLDTCVLSPISLCRASFFWGDFPSGHPFPGVIFIRTSFFGGSFYKGILFFLEGLPSGHPISVTIRSHPPSVQSQGCPAQLLSPFQHFQAPLEAGLRKPGSLPELPTPGRRYQPLLPPFWGAGVRGAGSPSLWAEGSRRSLDKCSELWQWHGVGF